MGEVYILIDNKKRLVQIEGSYTLPDNLAGWIKYDEGEGAKYNLAQTHYLDKPIRDERGVFRYKLYRNKITERSAAEMDADYVEPVPEPTQIDRIEAQTLYTALMTDTLIEEV